MSQAARAKKARAIPQDNPVLQALGRAPVGQPMTEEERRAMEEAREVGRWASSTKVNAEIAQRCKTGK